jgi:hypothetical protein
MSDTDPQQQHAGRPAQEAEPAPAPAEPPAAVPDEAQNPEQYLHWSRRARDPKDIQKK